jgi:hypothetical protein
LRQRDRLLFDHDFAFPNRFGIIARFHLTPEFAPVIHTRRDPIFLYEERIAARQPLFLLTPVFRQDCCRESREGVALHLAIVRTYGRTSSTMSGPIGTTGGYLTCPILTSNRGGLLVPHLWRSYRNGGRLCRTGWVGRGGGLVSAQPGLSEEVVSVGPVNILAATMPAS